MAVQVVTFGELLIDFVATERGVSVGQAPGFTKAPGGAPANVAVGLAKLGLASAFIGQVGADFFGAYLTDILREAGVDVSALRQTAAAMTPLAFVSVAPDGEREFVFYRKPSADMLMQPTDLDTDMLRRADIFHFGSISLIDEPLRSTTLAAIEVAQAGGARISYDPNWRPALWPDEATAREGMRLGARHANIIKVSEEELFFMAETTDTQTAIASLWTSQVDCLVITRGAQGSIAYTAPDAPPVVHSGFRVDVADTIGAGDGFVAGLLSGILQNPRNWRTDMMTVILRRANAVGALTASRAGAIPALPTQAEVEQFLAQHDAH
ncbi:MAG: PfkB family carbohydrate kinase [Anaerolineales bacterium]